MNYSVEETISKMEELKRNKESLMSWVTNEISSGCQQFDRCSCGETIDMIKDLAETEKNCWESLYYQTVINAMSENNPNEYMGYNNRRMTNGQYAPAGRGHMGYRPYVDQEPYINAYMHDPEFRDNMMMGYSKDERSNNSNSENSTYYGYQSAKKAYHENGKMSDKERMNSKGMEYTNEVVRNLTDIWEDADPMLKRKIKEDLKIFVED